MAGPDEAKGRAKEAGGAITNDRDLKREGKLDRASDRAKDTIDKVKDKAQEATPRN